MEELVCGEGRDRVQLAEDLCRTRHRIQARLQQVEVLREVERELMERMAGLEALPAPGP